MKEVHRLLSVPEAVTEFFSGTISTAAVYNLISQGQIEHLRIGRRILIPEDSLIEFFNRNTRRLNR